MEGGASTTFQIALPDDFLTSLKAVHSEAGRTGARFGAFLYILRDSSDVTWDTTSGTTHKDRTAEYTISYNGTEIQPRYSAQSSTLPERTWVYIPLTGTPPGRTSSFAGVDDFAAASFPITFTIKAESDTTYFEKESIRVRGRFLLSGSQANPTFTSIRYNSNDLTFDLVEGPLPVPMAKPTTPANLTAASGRGAVTLTWDAVDDTGSNTNRLNDLQITKYEYCQKTDTSACGASDWIDIPNSAYGEANANTYTIDSLTNNTAYTFRVRAVNECTTTTGCGISDASTAATATPVATARARPTGLKATAGNTQVTLTWTDPGDATITFYEYQQKEGLAAVGPWTAIPGSSATTKSYRLTGLDNGTAYVYRIRAGRGPVTSLASDAVTVTPQGAPPAAPVLTATPHHGSVTLSWPNPGDPTIREYEYQYKVGSGVYQPWRTARRRTVSECGAETIGDCAPPYFDTRSATLEIGVDGLANGTPHTFRVRAVNADGATTSNEASATPVAGVPAKPTGLTTSVDREVFFYRWLYWDRVEDLSILRYEFTVDAGRTWSYLTSGRGGAGRGLRWSNRFPRGEFDGRYIFRIRAVNAAGPGPASDPAVVEEATETVTTARRASNLRVEWDSSTEKATLAWDAAADDVVRSWSVYFGRANSRNKVLPVGTTRYVIPGTFSSGALIRVLVAGCLRTVNCGDGGFSSYSVSVRAGIPRRPSGFSATPGDRQITLAWDAPTDSSITHFEYEVDWPYGLANGHTDIPDGPDAGSSAADETSHTVTTISSGRVYFHPAGALVNGNTYYFRLRAVNTHGAGPWTRNTPGVMPLAKGVPGAPGGLVTLLLGGDKSLTTWDDPQDPSITGYQQLEDGRPRVWKDIPGSDATTTGVHDLPLVGVTNIGMVRAVNANGVGPPTRTTIVVSPAPARPTGLRAAPANGRVTLTWDDPGKDVYIQSWRYTADDGETWTQIPDSQTTAQGHLTRYTVPGLTNGRAYTFAIQAVNDAGTSPVSAPATATPQGAAPAKPTGLAAAPGNAEATLTWDNPGDASITKYQIKRGTANWADISGSGAATTSHTVSSLANGTSVTFQIRAVNDHNGDNTDDPGAASDAVSVTPGVPAAPATLSVAPGNAQVTLTWTAPASNNGSAVTGYEYTANPDAATPTWTDVPDSNDSGTSRADETAYTVSSLTNNTTHAFAVRAENANGQGVATPTVRARPVNPNAPQQPGGFRAEPGQQQVRLTWTLPSFQHPVTAYQYRQSTNGGTSWSPDWTTITGSGAATTEHTLTSLANGTTYTFELRARKNGTAGPATRAQATPSAAAATRVITPQSSGEIGRFVVGGIERLDFNTHTFTTPDGDTYTVIRLLLPDDLNWRITVPGTTDIDGRTFTLLSLQGGTPETSPRYTFTSSGQEGLDVKVSPTLSGPVQVCLEPSDRLRLEASTIGQPLLLLRYDGTAWEALTTTYEHGMVCANVSSFSAFVLGYEDPEANEAPAATPRTISPQTVVVGRTVSVNVAPSFTDPNDDSLTYTATSSDTNKVTASVTGSELRLTGVDTGATTVTVTATDPDGETATQTVSVTVEANAPPVAAPPIPDQKLIVQVLPKVLVDLTQHFSDANDDSLTYSVGPGYDTGVVTATVPQASGVLTLTAVNEGTTTVSVTATDPAPGRLTASQMITVTVSADPGDANVAPAVREVIPVQELTVGGAAVTMDLNAYFTDLNGDALTYTAPSPDGNVVTAEVSGSRLSLTAVGVGTVVVQVTAEDPAGLQALLGVAVAVTGAPAARPATERSTNAPPRVAQPMAPQTLPAGTTSEPLDLTPYFRDPDGDPLRYAAASGDVSVAIADLPRGSSQLTLQGVAAGQVIVTVTASDPQGASVSQRLTVTVTGEIDTEPEKAPTSALPEVARRIPPQIVAAGEAGAPLDLAPYFRDPDGDPLTYAAVSYDADVLTAEVAAGTSELTLRGVAPGDAGVIVTATDPSGGSASQPVAVRVRTNTVLEAARFIPPQIVEVGGASEPLDLAPYFHDPDGDPLTYVAASDDTDVLVAEVAAGSSQLVLRGVAAGEAKVIVVAGDLFGERARQTVEVTVRANAAPEVAQAVPPQIVVAGAASAPLDLAAYFRDPDGDPLTYAAISHDTGVVAADMAAGGSEIVLRGVAAGAARVIVGARDPFGRWARQTVRVTVRADAVAAAQPMPARTVVVAVGATSEPLDLAPYFHAADGVPLTYAAVSRDPGVVVAEVAAGSSQLVLNGVAVGEAVVDVTASDPHGGSASQTLTVRTSPRPAASLPIPVQAVAVGGRSAPLDLAPYFHASHGVRLTYAAVSLDPGVVIVHVPAGSSQLVLGGVSVGEAVVVVTASDPHGGSVMHALQVRTNTAPTVAQSIPAQAAAVGSVSAPLDLAPYFRDAEGDPLTYAAESDDTGVVIAEVPAGSSQLLLVGVAVGDAVATVTASDPWGGSVSQTLTVRTDPAPASQVARPLPAQVVSVGSRRAPLDLAPYFHDPDGAPLTYAAVSDDPGVVTAEVPVGSSQLVLSGVSVGDAVVTVTASDPYGGSASQTLTVRTNTAPIVAQPVPSQVVAVGGTSAPLDLAAYFDDPDGDPLTYAAVSDNPGVVTAEVPAGSSRLVLGGAAVGRSGRRRHGPRSARRQRHARLAGLDECRAGRRAAPSGAGGGGRRHERAAGPGAVLSRRRRRPADLCGGVGQPRRGHGRGLGGQQSARAARRGGGRGRRHGHGQRSARRQRQPGPDGAHQQRPDRRTAHPAAGGGAGGNRRAAGPGGAFPRPGRRPADLRGGVGRLGRGRCRGVGGRQRAGPDGRVGGRGRGRRHGQ